MTTDFRNTEPIWVRYAEFIDSKSNKFYECRVDLDDDGSFVITRRWGARPDSGVGQIKAERRHSDLQARGTATTYFTAKLAKGYVECERPAGASIPVAKDYDLDEDEDY